MRRRDRHDSPRLDEAQLATAWQAASLLLDYPTDELLRHLPQVEEATASLPRRVRDPLCRFLSAVDSTPLSQLQRDYVETFDVTRRCCLYLTYFAQGDTRKRGLALVQLKQAYRRAGVELAADELPDHLSVVLEFGATCDLSAAWTMLNDHRAGIEMLRIALSEKQSPWHDVVLGLVATLPELRGEDAHKVAALIVQGPPDEQVGLELQPYAIDPRLNPRPSESVPLGQTIPVGAP